MKYRVKSSASSSPTPGTRNAFDVMMAAQRIVDATVMLCVCTKLCVNTVFVFVYSICGQGEGLFMRITGNFNESHKNE